MKPKTKTQTPAPDTLDLTDELRAWVHAHARQVDLVFEREKFLQHCRAHEIENINWIEAFKLWLLEADRRARDRGHRPGVGPDPVVAQLRAHRRREVPAEWRAEPDPAPVPGGEAAWVRIGPYHGMHVDCGTVHQYHAPCPAATSRRTPATDTGPPSESSTLHQRYVVQTAEDHGFIGLGETVAAAARNGHGHGHEPTQEDPP
jgi:hypothetical protein